MVDGFWDQSSQMLIKEVTEKEIKDTLFRINDNKSSGVDGLNASFFKKTWDITKQELLSFIKGFFEKRDLFPPFNCTSITLIPKTSSANMVGDYYPIAYCTVIYKSFQECLQGGFKR